MSAKTERQHALLGIIRKRDVATQSELRSMLAAAGHEVDQATLSRDIKDLGLVKAPTATGYRYAPVDEVSPVIPARATGILGRFTRSVSATGQLLVLKTDAGSASPVAEALDHLGLKEVIGTLAGDNTVFVACRSSAAARRAAAHIFDMTQGGA